MSSRTTSISARSVDRRADCGSAKPVLEIVGGPGGVTQSSLRELWAFRDVYTAFTLRQVKVKYKQAAIGVGWAVFQPLVSALLFTVFLGRLVHVPSDGMPYLVFALLGMACWSYFSGAASSAMESLVADQAIIRKIYFPRELLPLAAVSSSLLDFAVGLAVALTAAWSYGYDPGITWLALPLPALLLVLTATALGLGVSSLNVFYRDVRYAVPFLLQLALFATPVFYPLSQVPASWREPYAIAYPPAAAIDATRQIVGDRAWPDLTVFGAALAWVSVLVLLSYVLFKRLERQLADRI